MIGPIGQISQRPVRIPPGRKKYSLRSWVTMEQLLKRALDLIGYFLFGMPSFLEQVALLLGSECPRAVVPGLQTLISIRRRVRSLRA